VRYCAGTRFRRADVRSQRWWCWHHRRDCQRRVTSRPRYGQPRRGTCSSG
jgi:hypothetical protein